VYGLKIERLIILICSMEYISREEILHVSTLKKSKNFVQRTGLILFLMALPTVIYIFIFHYLPIGGLVIAFKDYNSFMGIFGSPWASVNGATDIFKHFKNFVTSSVFGTVLRNTLRLSILSIVFNMITPIIFALLVNEIPYKKYAKVVQTIMYAPYFISIVVLVGMLKVFFDQDSGIFTRILMFFGYEKQNALGDPNCFAAIYIISGIWQGLGWWSITYMGTLANVDPNLHDAAVIDGAGRWRRIFHINFQSILPLAVIMLIMSMGNILNVGFEKVYLMQLNTNLDVSNIISTYVYRISFPDSGLPQFSYATAIGLFNSVINIIILVIANFISRKVSDNSLW